MWFETTYRCPRCSTRLIYSEDEASVALRCRYCGLRVWAEISTARRLVEDRAFNWRALMDALFLAYASRLAMVEN